MGKQEKEVVGMEFKIDKVDKFASEIVDEVVEKGLEEGLKNGLHPKKNPNYKRILLIKHECLDLETGEVRFLDIKSDPDENQALILTGRTMRKFEDGTIEFEINRDTIEGF